MKRVATFLRALWRPSASSDPFHEESDLLAYWRAYGGAAALLESAYLWAAIAITIALYPFWSSGDWNAVALSVLPNLLGFSLGALAIVLAFPSAGVFAIIAEDGDTKSYYIDLAAKFVHFVLLQVLAFLFAIFAKSYPGCGQNFIGCTLFVYALTSAWAVGLTLFGVAKIANASAAIAAADNDDEARR